MNIIASILDILFEILKRNETFSEYIAQNNLVNEYDYDFISYKFIFYSINIIISPLIIGFLFYINNNFNLWKKYELYISCILFILVILIIELYYMISKYEKLKRICLLTKDNDKTFMLSQTIEKHGFIKSKWKSFISLTYSCCLGALFMFRSFFNNEIIINIILPILIVIYFSIFIFLFIKALKYNRKYYIISNMVIRADFTKQYDCCINIKLNRNVKIKIENEMVYIQKRKDLLYLFPSEYLIDVQTWYKFVKI